VVDVLRGLVVGGVETGRCRGVLVGDADATGSEAGGLVGDGVDTALAEGAVEVAGDVPRTGVATGTFDGGAVT
jgi:hypothetical protein